METTVRGGIENNLRLNELEVPAEGSEEGQRSESFCRRRCHRLVETQLWTGINVDLSMEEAALGTYLKISLPVARRPDYFI